MRRVLFIGLTAAVVLFDTPRLFPISFQTDHLGLAIYTLTTHQAVVLDRIPFQRHDDANRNDLESDP